MDDFREELQRLINANSKENGSNTPDFILAEYLTECLDLFDRTVNRREVWYGRTKQWDTAILVDLQPSPLDSDDDES